VIDDKESLSQVPSQTNQHKCTQKMKSNNQTIKILKRKHTDDVGMKGTSAVSYSFLITITCPLKKLCFLFVITSDIFSVRLRWEEVGEIIGKVGKS
jgi:hypothetical protein